MSNSKATGRPAIANRAPNASNYNNNSSDEEPIIRVQNNKPITIRSQAFDFTISDQEISIYVNAVGKHVFSITKSEIIIGNPNGEHIKLPIQ